jgi:hypothetical protein
MKTKLQIAGIISVLVSVPAAFTQSNETVKREGNFLMQLPPPPPGALDHTFEFVASEFSFDGKVVKNAPYSAEAVTEMTQTLADGNRISNKTTANLYRDSEGRTRREEKLGAVGPWASNSEPMQTVFINDPVTDTHMVLDARNKIARKMPSPKLRMAGGPPGAIAVSGAMVGTTTAGIPAAGVADGGMKANISRRVTVAAGGGEPDVLMHQGTMMYMTSRNSNEDSRTESLGSQTIEGVRADGTRTTTTIPAGAMGNERPIQIVSERWYSPELQTVVKTTRNDPRMGETVYRLSIISRTEPARSLFEPPSDYTTEDADVFMRKMKMAAEEKTKAKD